MAGARNVLTWIDTILLAARDKLISAGCVQTANCVLIRLPETGSEQIPSPPGDLYYEVIPGPQRVWQGVVTGGGNDTFYIRGLMEVHQWSRLDVDREGTDEAYLTDATLGAPGNPGWRLLCGSLQMWDPTNTNGDFILGQPCRLDDSGYTIRPRRRPGWGWFAGAWQIYHLAAQS